MSAERREITTGPAETERLGARIAAALRPGDLVLVSGELGSGKTTLIRGAARALGVREPVVSPTFTLGRRYAGEGVTVSHLDLYRLEDPGGEEPGLLDEYLTGDAIAFVEWPQGAAELGWDEGRVALRIGLEHAGGDRRTVTLAGPAAAAVDGTAR